MPTEKYMIFVDINTNEENIVDMDKGEPLTINETCDLLNKLTEQNEEYKSIVKSLKDVLKN